jgi:thiol-disulfide isomerase/thioredoxin
MMPKFIALLVVTLMLTSAQAVVAQEAPLGTSMPQLDRSLQNVNGGTATLGSLRGSRGTVLVFWSNQCPWVDRYEERVLAIASRFRDQGVNLVLVNPNDPAAFPQEAAAEGQARAQSGNYGSTPYVMDSGAQLARALGAGRTPHVFAFDANGSLIYVGGIDDSPGDPDNVQRNYLSEALDASLGGRPIGVAQTRAFGCTIKFP